MIDFGSLLFKDKQDKKGSSEAGLAKYWLHTAALFLLQQLQMLLSKNRRLY